ncbi:hypothetical protein ACQKIE_16040 [Luteibacter sp. NPDC031894]|uniref:hypothetical protein n=1 Tax=Luteibacter sp. NPDC031894 TaxID=3390572 RepID=UPI003D07B313
MCAVAAVPWVIAAITAASAVYSADQQKKQGQYAADVAEENSKLDKQQAANAAALGDYQADQARIRGNLARGQQLAAFAANNVDSTTGSAADILGDTAIFTAEDERQARTNAALRSYGFQVQALSDQGQAAYSKWAGNSAATGTLIQGAGSTVGAFYGAGGSLGGGGAKPGNTLLTGGSYNGTAGTQSYSTRWAGYGNGWKQ